MAITTTTPSRKLIAEWSDQVKVEIYDSCTWRVRLYSDRAVVLMPTTKWVGNTGGYHEDKYRVVGNAHAQLLQIAREETEDGEDYTDRVYAVLCEDRY